MGGNMKTTIDIAEPVLRAARRKAAKDGTTLKQLTEAGLRLVLAQDEGSPRVFRLRDASFGGKGLQPGVTPGRWESLREAIYEGRGA